jgi:hypothetical protein
MPFTRPGGGADRSVELVRQSLLQSDGFAFSDALTDEQIQQAFNAEGVSFGTSARDADSVSPKESRGQDSLLSIHR